MNAAQALAAAVAHHQAGRLAAAVKIYRELLRQDPDHADALHLLGTAALQSGQPQAALPLLHRAITLRPRAASYHNNLGQALLALGRLGEAVPAFRRAIALQPGHPDAHNNLGNALRNLGHLPEAIASYRRALALAPQDADVLNNLANALKDQGELDEAVNLYRQALRAQPDRAAIHNNLGNALADQGQMADALPAFRRAVELDPRSPALHSNLLYAQLFDAAHDDRRAGVDLQEWERRHATPRAVRRLPHPNVRDVARRLRVGYVSAHFRQHVVGRNVLPLIERHDRGAFEIYCYAHVMRPDALTERFRTAAQGWRNIAALSDTQVAAQVREDGIDLLVDLTLHMEGTRLPIYAEKPAPVQVTFAGYPGTTGLRAIDYRLTDPHLDPPGIDETVYAERSVRLPRSFWCYAPIDNEVPVGDRTRAETDAVTFGCLNNFWKVTPPTLRLWARVLREVQHSRLVLLCPPGSHRARVARELTGDERSPRVEFVARQSRADYFALHQQIDVMLDTFPYNGHTTTLDALWMGVPVVSLAGQPVVSRAGRSILTNLGLPGLVTETEADFVRVAVELARDLPRRAVLRSALRPQLQSSALMDEAGFTRGIETAYREMWRRWCASSAV